jgi:hypothetical protein
VPASAAVVVERFGEGWRGGFVLSRKKEMEMDTTGAAFLMEGLLPR